jgi:3D (Asp-Asp-Asp) domain-containing protein
MQNNIVRVLTTVCVLSFVACGGSSSTGTEGDGTTQDQEAMRRWHHGRHLGSGTASDAGTASPAPTTTSTATAAPTTTSTATPAPTTTPTAAPPSGSAATYVTHELTFYGYPDNDPPGAGIALPTIHSKAGGTGTYADPVTFASAPGEFKAGAILYVPFLKKYVIMEDTCAQCTSDWSAGKRHIDVWMNSDATNGAKLLSCQYAWTRDAVDVELSPPEGRPVDPTPLFDPKTGVCLTP